MIRREENNPKNHSEHALCPWWNYSLKVVGEAPGSVQAPLCPAALRHKNLRGAEAPLQWSQREDPEERRPLHLDATRTPQCGT